MKTDSINRYREEKLKNNFKIFIVIWLILIITLFFVHAYSNYLVSNFPERLFKLEEFDLNGVKDDLSFRRLEENDPGEYTFKTQISREKFLNLSESNYKIIVSQLSGDWYSIYLNDTLIGGLGNQEGVSNIWNAFAGFDISQSLLQEDNKLEIRVSGSHEIGVFNLPILITEHSFGNRLLTWFNFIIANLNIVAAGFILFSAIFLLFVYNSSKELGKEYLYFAIGILFFFINIFDHVVIYDIRISYFTFKRITILALYFSIFFMSLAVYKKYKSKLIIIPGILVLVCIIFLLIYPSDLISFMRYHNLLNSVFLLNVISWLIITALNFKSSYESKILFFASLMAFYDVFNFVFILGSEIPSNLNTSVASFLGFPIGIVFLIITHYLHIQRDMLYERIRSDVMYKRSIKDEMTDLYTHQYIIDYLEKGKTDYILVMIDIDDFKVINDTYGHLIGDKVIKHIADCIKNNLREVDIAGRYGGDEFIIIFNNQSLEDVLKIVKRLRSKIEQAYYTEDGRKIKITISIGIYDSAAGESSEFVLSKVDKALYQAKESGKAQIKIIKDGG